MVDNNDDISLLTKGFSILLFNNPDTLLSTGSGKIDVKSTILYQSNFEALKNAINNEDNKNQLKYIFQQGIENASLTSAFTLNSNQYKEIKKLIADSKAPNKVGLIETKKQNKNSEKILNVSLAKNQYNELLDILKNINSSSNSSVNKGSLGSISLDITGKADATSSLAQLLNKITSEKFKTETIKNKFGDLKELLLGEKNSLKSIFNELMSIKSGDVDVSKISLLIALTSLINSLTSLSKLGIISTIKMKISLSMISNLMKKDIIKLFELVNDVAQKAEKTENVDVTLISDFINSLAGIGDITFLDILKTKFLFNELRDIYTSDLKDLLIDIQNISNDSDKAELSAKSVFSIFDTILKIKDIDIKTIINIRRNLTMLSNIFEDIVERFIEISANYSTSQSENHIKSLDNINNVSDKLLDLTSTLSLVKLLTSQLKLNALVTETQILGNLIKAINKIEKINKKDTTIENNIVNPLNKIFIIYDLFTNKNFPIREILSSPKLINGLIVETKLIIKLIDNINELIKATNNIEEIKSDKLKLFDANNKDGLIFALNNINNIANTLNKIKDIESILKVIKNVNQLVQIIGKILEKTNDATIALLIKQVEGIKSVIDKLNEIKPDELENARKAIITFSLLVAVSAGILIAGSMLMAFIDIKNLFSFTLTLKAFIFGLSYVYNKFAEESKLTLDGAKAFMFIVVASGALLLAAGLLIDDIPILKVALFGAVLAGFVYLLSFPYKNFIKKDNKLTLLGAAAFSLILVTSGALLIAAGLLFDEVNILKVIGFAVVLGLFVWGLSFVFNNFADNAGTTMQGALGFSILLVVTGALLLAGSYMWDMMWHGDTLTEKALNGIKSLLFVALVGLFVWGLSFALNANRRGTMMAMDSAKGIALLLIVAGAILIAGSYMWDMMWHGDTLDEKAWNGIKSILFCLLLVGFIKLLVWAIQSNAEQAATALPMAGAIALLVVVTGGILLLATRIIRDENDLEKIGIFTLCTLALVGGMTAVVYVLSQLQKSGHLVAGMLALAGIAVILYGMAAIMEKLVATANVMDPIKLLELLGLMGLALVEITAILMGLGAILFAGIPAAVLALGAVAILPLIGIMNALNSMMFGLAINSNMVMALVSKDSLTKYFDMIGFAIDGLYGVVKGTDQHKGLVEFAGPIITPQILASTKAIRELSIALMFMAMSIQQWANLRIPSGFDSEGNPTGFIELTSNDFTTAVSNISQASGSLIKGILDIYKQYKDTGAFSLNLVGSTPFHRVINGVKRLGPVLSSIAKSVQDWANLRIPLEFDENGKPKTYIPMHATEFKTATDNIANAVGALIQGIVDVYKYDKENNIGAFDDWGGLVNTPFSKVIKGAKKLGPVLSSIAKGVKDWASLKIPVKWDDKGNAIDYITIGKSEFDIVSNNIRDTISAMIKGLLALYVGGVKYGSEEYKYKDLFPSTDWWNPTKWKSPLGIVISSLKSMGPMLSSIAKGFKEWANLRIPIKFDKNGNPIDYTTIGKEEFKKVPENIKLVISALAGGLLAAYKDLGDKKLIISSEVTGIEGFGGLIKLGNKKQSSPLIDIAKAIGIIGITLGAVGAGIKEWSSVKIPTGFDKDGKATGYLSISQAIGQLNTNINLVLTAMGNAIVSVYNNDTKGVFNTTDEKSPAMVISKSINIISGALINVAKAIQGIVGGKIIEYDKNGKVIKEIDITSQLKSIEDGTLKSRIENICLGIADPIRGVYENTSYKQMWTSYGTGKSPGENIAASIAIVMNSLSSIVDTISKISEMDKDGKVTQTIDAAFKTINNILGQVIKIFGLFGDPDTMKAIIDANGGNMQEIKTGRGSAILDFLMWDGFSGKKTIAEWMNDSIPNITKAQESIKTLVTNITSLVTDLQNLETEFTKSGLLAKLNPVKSDSVFTHVSDLLSTFINIVDNGQWKLLYDALDKYEFDDVHVGLAHVTLIFSDTKNGLFVHMQSLNNRIRSMNYDQEVVKNNIIKILSTYVDILTNFKSKIDTSLLTQINRLYTLLWNSKFITKNDYLINTIKSISKVVWATNQNSKQIINNIKNIEFKLLESSIDILTSSWEKIINKINKLNEQSTTVQSTFNIVQEENYANIYDLFSVIDEMLNLSTRIETTPINTTPFEELAKGVSIIDITAQNIKANNALKQQQEVMKKYIDTINSIDLYKLNTMFNFAESMNKLADKLGNLDDLTDALGNKLTVVLANLIKEMKVAEDTIKNADLLRQKRETLIKDSIKEMKNIMDQHLVVDIFNQSTNQNLGDDEENPNPPTETDEKKDNVNNGGGNDDLSSKGSTPEYKDAKDIKGGPLLKPSEKSKAESDFTKQLKKKDNTNLQITETINSTINSTLRSIFLRNGKDYTQVTLNLKPGYK